MQQTQIITCGIDGPLLERLQELAQARRWWLRPTSQPEACRDLVHASPPSVLIVRLGRDLEDELALLEWVHRALPATASIAVGEADNPVLAGLAWEMGVTYALFPPTPIEAINDLIVRLLEEKA